MTLRLAEGGQRFAPGHATTPVVVLIHYNEVLTAARVVWFPAVPIRVIKGLLSDPTPAAFRFDRAVRLETTNLCIRPKSRFYEFIFTG